jgi:hypothetical protein
VAELLKKQTEESTVLADKNAELLSVNAELTRRLKEKDAEMLRGQGEGIIDNEVEGEGEGNVEGAGTAG